MFLSRLVRQDQDQIAVIIVILGELALFWLKIHNDIRMGQSKVAYSNELLYPLSTPHQAFVVFEGWSPLLSYRLRLTMSRRVGSKVENFN